MYRRAESKAHKGYRKGKKKPQGMRQISSLAVVFFLI